MKFIKLPIEGAWQIEIQPIGDERGFFARAYAEEEFAAHGIDFSYSQTNLSYCVKAGTIRGMHYQTAPNAEAKLLRCIKGQVFDVMIDLRPESPTYLQSHGVEISAAYHQMIYIPAYCAHGYQAMVDESEVLYSTSSPYTPGAEKGIRWNDPKFALNWPIKDNVIVSEKDSKWPDFS